MNERITYDVGTLEEGEGEKRREEGRGGKVKREREGGATWAVRFVRCSVIITHIRKRTFREGGGQDYGTARTQIITEGLS